MAVTEDVVLPSNEELTVQEITVSSPYLRATANYMGYYCDDKCKVNSRFRCPLLNSDVLASLLGVYAM